MDHSRRAELTADETRTGMLAPQALLHPSGLAWSDSSRSRLRRRSGTRRNSGPMDGAGAAQIGKVLRSQHVDPDVENRRLLGGPGLLTARLRGEHLNRFVAGAIGVLQNRRMDGAGLDRRLGLIAFVKSDDLQLSGASDLLHRLERRRSAVAEEPDNPLHLRMSVERICDDGH